MINLGEFKAGTSVFYGANFHNDQATIEDPTAPEAQLRTPAGVWGDLTAPAKQNGKTGHFGGAIDTTGFAPGQYIVRVAGTVATAKTMAAEFCFTVVANIEADTYALVDAIEGGATPEEVWAYETRDLTSFGSLVSTIVTRILGNLSTGVFQSFIAVTDDTPITVTRGDYLPAGTISFNFGSAWDCTGKKVFFCVKKDKKGEKLLDIECTLIDEINGIGYAGDIDLENDALPAGGYHYEFEIFTLEGEEETKPRTPRRGQFIIQQDVRQPLT